MSSIAWKENDPRDSEVPVNWCWQIDSACGGCLLNVECCGIHDTGSEEEDLGEYSTIFENHWGVCCCLSGQANASFNRHCHLCIFEGWQCVIVLPLRPVFTI